MVISKLWSKSTVVQSAAHPTDPYTSDSEPSILHDGDLAYTWTKGENGSKPSYQEAVGARVESRSPLRYNVGWVTVIFLNVNQMIGTGIISTRRHLYTILPICILFFSFWSGGVY
jgi:hypothetical protein